ncbi:MAG: c-type cytochrome [Chloroflexota bacterium]
MEQQRRQTRLQRRWILFLVISSTLVVTACSQLAVASNGSGSTSPFGSTRLGGSNGPTLSVTDGRQLYLANCATCHGDQGERVPVAPLNSKQFLDSRGDATLIAAVSEGKGVMPAWGRVRGGPFNEEQVRAVVAYLSTTAGRTSPSLRAGAGRAVFQQECVACHGDKGDRIPVAPLSAKAFVDSRTDADLTESVSAGKGLMPGFKVGAKPRLTEEQVLSVVSYLRFNAEASLADQARHGRDLFLANCLACHGERGDRVPNTPLKSAEYLAKLGDGGLITAIAEGKGVMPGFVRSKGGTFEVSDVGALLVYLKSGAGFPAGSALTGPEVPSQGRDLFLKNCSGCHGEGGDRVGGVRLRSKEFLAGRTDDLLQRAISSGNSRGMPAWGQANGGPLADADIAKLVEFLRSSAIPSAPAIPAASASPAPVGAAPPAPPAPAAAQTAGADPARVAQGKELFTKNCVVCHGDTRDKVPTCKLDDAAWLKEKGDATLGTSIKQGKGAMPPIGAAFTPAEIEAILAYLKDAAGGAATAPPTAAAAPATPAPPGGASAPSAAPGAAASAPAAAAVQTAGADPARVAQGKELFTKNCVICHGDTRDKVPTCKLDDAAWLKEKGDATLGTSIKQGKGAMPPIGAAFTPAEIEAILAYLKSAAGGQVSSAGGPAPPAAPPDPTVPQVAVNPTVGRELFSKNCVACHGDDGMRQPNCPLGSAEWLAAMPDDALKLRIDNGKPSVGMPAWNKRRGGSLSDSQVGAIIAYLAELAPANARTAR